MATQVAKPPAASTAPSAAVTAVVGKPKAGFDLRRPFRYTWGFVSGTFNDSLNLSSSLGRKGIWVGAGLGILAAMSGMGAIMIFMGMVGGLAAGAVGGLGVGAITGGFKGVARVKRVENNAEQAAHREQSKPVRQQVVQNGPDYRERAREQRLRNNYAIDRTVQSERELQQDISWVDRVSAGHHDHGRGW